MSELYTLTSLDNPTSAGSAFLGKTFPFRYDGERFYFGALYSSTVSSIEHYEGKLTIITRNTVYKFEKVTNGS